jgi:hypothetical protein
LLRPIIALGGALDDLNGYKKAIWQLSLRSYNLQLDLSIASVIYGLAGVMLGSLIAQILLVPFRRRHTVTRAMR